MNCCKGFSYSPLSTCHLVDNKICLIYNYDVSYTNLNYTVLHCTAVLLYVMMYMYVRTVGSCYYTAPEVLAGSYDYRCDTWSLVRHIFRIITAYHPLPSCAFILILTPTLTSYPSCHPYLSFSLKPPTNQLSDIILIFSHPHLNIN